MAISDRIAAVINATNGINDGSLSVSPFDPILFQDHNDEVTSEEGWINLANIDQIVT